MGGGVETSGAEWAGLAPRGGWSGARNQPVTPETPVRDPPWGCGTPSAMAWATPAHGGARGPAAGDERWTRKLLARTGRLGEVGNGEAPPGLSGRTLNVRLTGHTQGVTCGPNHSELLSFCGCVRARVRVRVRVRVKELKVTFHTPGQRHWRTPWATWGEPLD